MTLRRTRKPPPTPLPLPLPSSLVSEAAVLLMLRQWPLPGQRLDTKVTCLSIECSFVCLFVCLFDLWLHSFTRQRS